MRIAAILGVAGGAVVALGTMTAAQWHAIGVALLVLALRYGLLVLPWLLAVLFAWLWWRERGLVDLWRVSYNDQTTYYAARMADMQQSAPRRPHQRRSTRR